MNFLYPGFLFALLSVAIPVIIHLFNFRKFKKVYFSNVQLLKEVEQQNSSKEKLKNLLILLSRILAIAFLVLAFAQPYVPANKEKTTINDNIVSIYIDNSFSMDAINKDGSLLDEARRSAKELVKGFGLNDRFQLLTNDFEGKHQRLINKEEFVKALDDIKVSAANRTLQEILNRQSNILTGSANKYSFIISDFQKNISGQKKLDTKKDIQYSFLKLNATNLPNIAVDSVWTLSPNHQPSTNERLVVQLKNYSDDDAKNIPLKLSINNQQKAISSVNISAGKTVKDTLSFSGLVSGWQKAIISIKDFPITFDDSLLFSFNVDENFQALSINGNSSQDYIKALFNADNYYRLTSSIENNINYSNFSSFGLIVLNGIKTPSTGLAQQLKTYVNGGGTVVVFPDLDADLRIYNTFLNALTLPSIQVLNTTPTKVDKIDLQNPVFKSVFEDVPKNLDLPAVNRYFSFADNNSANREDILQLPGGKLFFAKYGVGKGNIYLSASGLNQTDGNFARHPIFVPLMFRLSLNGGNESDLYSTIGNENVLTSRNITIGKNQTLKLSSDGFESIPEVRFAQGKTLIYTADQIKNPGFYNLKLSDSLLAVYAFNSNRSESDMHYLDKSALANLAERSNLKIYDTDKDAVKLISGENQIGQTLWKLCLILSLIFIAAEILLIRFFNNPKKTI
ncbi:BatA domain-containing protein [Pedobacter aquatilis]|uniref:BatA domain-containing protein n=1 Tax=Pedobacter aquatilis TaxID=351343 RepID=UPI0025B3D392|nr:BatA domain-containing protein [Pedobacter aquatilis]MDN3588442.1 BatA domain-containing protein [Pedobacter aquatilis]